MRWLRLTPICCFLVIALACGGVGRVYERRLVGDIGLSGLDTMGQMAVVQFSSEGHAMRLVPPTVFAVGWDQSHIVAKRHPSDEGSNIDKTRTEYYIVIVKNRRVYGPFDQAEYVLHCDLLGVAKDLDFTLTFRELE
jgi:hypothetical protein